MDSSGKIDGMTGATPPLSAVDSKKLDSMLEDLLVELDKPVNRFGGEGPEDDTDELK